MIDFGGVDLKGEVEYPISVHRMKMMTHFVVRILLIIGLVVATQDDYSEPVGVEEFRASIMREGAAMSPYQFNDNFIFTGLRGSEGHLLPGPVKKVSSNSPKLEGSLCDSCQGCKAIAFVWIFCWPTLIECGTKCLYCC
ncbi:hypothetical protein FOZ60_008837 [Perkinsus olseni]|uniref:Uncharacterized protein n=1 Tax=Perkinsus olseni TaxID=32597 RepID=A0A7J6NI94_PEROL|nr:hypothetical protein FOZ60_008837 [Perkinsus olseni]